MRVKQLSKALALLMIYLILSLTLISASVFASIYSVEVYGNDQAPGIIRPSDNLVVKTSSALPCSVSAAFTNDTYLPMSCGTGTPLSCSYTKSLTNASGEITVSVQESSSGETVEVYAYVDTTPPVIAAFSAASLGGKVRGAYTIIDQASLDYQDKCAGIKKVELILNNQVANTTSHPAGICNINSVITGTIPNYIGYVNTSIRILDYVDLPANATGSTVFIDAVLPKIKSTAKAYKTGTDEEVKTISTNSTIEREIDVVVEIDDNGLPPSGSVFGDFTQLDKTNGTNQNNLEASCTREEWNATYKCRFTGVKLKPAIANPKIMITATDQAQNTASANITLSFTVVNNAGTVTRLGPEESRCSGGTCYVKAGVNNITAIISTSSSFNDSNIFIQGTQASCFHDTAWKCRADATVSAGATQLTLTGTDDLGNPITGTGSVTVDSNAPSKIGPINVTPACPTSRQSLKITMNVSEAESPTLTIRADTGTISSNNLTTANCIKSTTNWQCALTVSNLKTQGINTDLKVIVDDLAGNQLVENIPVSVCVEVAEIPDLIEKIKTRGTLPKVDRKVASKITVKVPIGLSINLRGENVQILERSTPDCSDTPGISGSAYMLNDDSLNPILILPLKYNKDWDEDNAVKVNCTQEFKIKQGNTIYTQEEAEPITAELGVYNQALGNLDEAYTKKVTDIKKQIQALDKQIKTYDGINKILGTICNLAEGLGKINQLLQSLKSALWVVCSVLKAIPLTSGIAEAIWKAVNGAITPIQGFADSKIWPQGWVPTTGNSIGLLIKGTCSIYTCKFYDFNTWADISISIAAYYDTKNDKVITSKVCDKGGGCTTTYADGSTEVRNSDGTTVITSADGNTYTTIFPDGSKEVYDKTTGTRTTYDPNGNVIRVETPTPETTPSGSEGGQQPKIEPLSIPGQAVAPKGTAAGYYVDGSGNKYYVDSNGNVFKSFDTPAGPGLEPVVGQSFDAGSLKPSTATTETTPKPTPPTKPTVASGSSGSELSEFVNVYNKFYIWSKSYRLIAQWPSTGKVIYSDSLTGNALMDAKTFPPMTPAQSKMFDMNTRLQDALDAFMGDDGSWIYNPYKSKHYDGLCAPATLFNDRKEKQLLCKRLGCIEEMNKIGGPLEACEFEYSLDMCLYVDSARYKLEGAATFPKIIKNFFKPFFTNILGLGTTVAYLFVFPDGTGCVHYQHPMGYMKDVGGDIFGDKSLRSVACGLTGTLLSIRELIAFFKNPYNPLEGSVKIDPVATSGNDFCVGIDYSTK